MYVADRLNCIPAKIPEETVILLGYFIMNIMKSLHFGIMFSMAKST